MIRLNGKWWRVPLVNPGPLEVDMAGEHGYVCVVCEQPVESDAMTYCSQRCEDEWKVSHYEQWPRSYETGPSNSLDGDAESLRQRAHP